MVPCRIPPVAGRNFVWVGGGLWTMGALPPIPPVTLYKSACASTMTMQASLPVVVFGLRQLSPYSWRKLPKRAAARLRSH